MEIDPLKIPAFMRKKVIRKRDSSSSYLKPTEVPLAPPARPMIIETPPAYTPPVAIPKKPKTRKPKTTRKKSIFSPTFFTSTPSAQVKPVSQKPEKVLTPAGVITHYLDNINVAILKLGTDVEVGDRLQLVGENGSFKQKLKSMQIDRKPVGAAKRGQEIGLKVSKKVVVGELVYLIG